MLDPGLNSDTCAILTMFMIFRLNIWPTGHKTLFSSDNGSYGRYFGINSRDGSTTRTALENPACFGGTPND